MSPVAGLDVSGGDIAYTEALVARPPSGVTYTTYPDAMAQGTLVERGRRPKHGRLGARDGAILAARTVEVGLRKAGVLFREPYRYLTIDPDAFDLVHSHVFPVRQVASRVPMVTSSGFPLPVLYRDRMGWSDRRAAVASWGERLASGVTGTEMPWRPPRNAALSMVQSEHYRNLLLSEGAASARVVVRPLGIDGVAGTPRTGPPRTIGFISTIFEEKGGPVALEAVRAVRSEHPEVTMVVAGIGARPDVDLQGGAVSWLGPVPRPELLASVLPSIDILVHPTPCDSGPPYVILEALQQGIPVVTTNLSWIDEGLTGPGVRRVPATPATVAGALSELMDPATYVAASRAAIDLWSERYSMDVLAEEIGESYQRALALTR